MSVWGEEVEVQVSGPAAVPWGTRDFSFGGNRSQRGSQ